MSGDSSWETFIKALGKDLTSDGGPLNLNKDADLLKPGAKGLMYPGDLFDHGKQAFIFFNVRNAATGITPVSQPLGNICLYMPTTLRVDYNAKYTEAGQPLEKLIETGRTIFSSMKDSVSGMQGIDFSSEGLLDIAKRAGNGLISDDTAKYFTHNIIKKTLGAEYAAEFRQKMGVAINPFLANVYDHPEFRTFNFEFEFFPKNPKESEQVRRIIKLFKLAMHPTRTGGTDNLIWGFPCVFDVFLCTPWTDKMFMIKRSALLRADVDYAAGGVQSFFKDGHPTQTKLGLSFKELELLTREDVENNY